MRGSPTPYFNEVARWMAGHSSPTFRETMRYVTTTKPQGAGQLQLQEDLRSLLERRETTD